ncbi:hypothetical protein FT663_03943 [Candidozyma haemuli var. vulneris]|nr:hypothetical protein FT662_03372 [[Candida] haemuloni var. vulneris]KAF3988647.1 hypothetical protein FT663_03943 [[Candida] haemuloni var. vulneris]
MPRVHPDWITVGVLLAVFFLWLEPAQPFYRQFLLSDSRLQHPFAEHERVTDNELYFLSAIVPTLIIAFFSLKTSSDTKGAKYHLLGLWVSLAVNGCITDLLKNWIGNPRPDFLDRCTPSKGTPIDSYVLINVCTAPRGPSSIIDGMKSTPSGHSSIGFSGLFYLSLWAWQWARAQKKEIKYASFLLVAAPTMLATYIALSRVQDYRHHFFDVFFGSALGIAAASLSWLKYQ